MRWAGASQAAPSSQPTVSAAAKSTIAFTAGNASSVNSPAVGSPAIDTRAGTMAASAAATHPAMAAAAMTMAVTDQGSWRLVVGSTV